MSDEESKEVVEEGKDTEVPPLEVKVVNEKKEKSSIYDDSDDEEYDELGISDKEIEEHDSTSSK